jgi:putative sigma-54 modulation protein
MNVSYKGVQKTLAPKLQGKLDAKFAKLSKLLEKRGEREAHVVVTAERHLHKAEITLQFYDHQLVGLGSDADLFTAMSTALEKLEGQAVKQRSKWREKNRRSLVSQLAAESAPAAAGEERQTARRVFRVNHHERRKPMTLEEALLEMENGQEYMVYRDAEKECVSVLVRRRDGNFDLIES